MCVWASICSRRDWRLICLIAPVMPPVGRLTVGGWCLWLAFGLALGCAAVSGCGRFTSHDVVAFGVWLAVRRAVGLYWCHRRTRRRGESAAR